MGFPRSNQLTVAVFLTVTAFSCSLPYFGRHSAAPVQQAESGVKDAARSSSLSGVVDLNGCEPGYYQIKLQGTFEGANVQVESQSDEAGRFNLVAPPGQYIMTVNKGSCGAKQLVNLEQSTEHMFSITVFDTKTIEKAEMGGGRLPASVIIEPKR